MPEPCGRCKVLRDELHRHADEADRLREALEQARDLVAEAYSDDEDNDSPGNMAFAVLNHALSEALR